MKIFLLFFALCSFGFVNAQDNIKTVTIYFDFNSSTISIEESKKLNPLFIKGMNITRIEAHTDSIGSVAYNDALASRRLQSVLKHLRYYKDETSVLGEKEANQASNYVDTKFRKVDIFYEDNRTFLPVPPVIVEEVEEKDEPTLESGAEEFINSGESTLSIDLSIHFNPGTAVPLTDSYPELDRLVKFLQENKNLDAFLHGHVCCSDNLDISQRRAKYVFNYLVKNGIQSHRLQMKGHSNWEPKVDPEVTEEDRIANRRVIVVFTKK